MPINKNALQLFSDEDLRAEVNRRGFDMKRKAKRPTLNACLCGSKEIQVWLENGSFYYECLSCQRKSALCPTRMKAMKAWNETVFNDRYSN